MDIVSASAGAILGAPCWTAVKWLTKRYILEPRLLPFLDRKLKPYKKSSLHSDLDSLIVYMAIDWSEHHTLPNAKVYLPLYNKIKDNIGAYINKREYTIFTVTFTYYTNLSELERPTNSELLELQQYIRVMLLPILARVKTQLGPVNGPK